MSNPTTLNREGWLTAFAEAIAPVIKQRTGLSVPLSKTRLTVSFPRTRSTPNKKGAYTIGQCFHADGHKSGLHEILINPLRDVVIDKNGHGIGETIIHELLHASLAMGVGHKAPFARAAKQMGLDGPESKPTATVANEELVKLIREIADKIGPYPHKAIEGEWGKKQTTRLLKVQCVDCGYINEAGNGYTARITMTWIENAGLPTCPCGATMSLILDGEEDPAFVALKPVESSATYRVPAESGEGFDNRFQVRRTSSEHFGDTWSVIDFGAPETIQHKVGDKMETVELVQFDAQARLIPAESKANALEMIDALRIGLYTPEYLEDSQDWDDEDDDGSNPLADEDPDLDALLFVGDDEDEDPDYPEDAKIEESWTRVHPISGREVVVNFDYENEAARRDESGTRKSAQIANGTEQAMD
jgi:hypothetical protein